MRKTAFGFLTAFLFLVASLSYGEEFSAVDHLQSINYSFYDCNSELMASIETPDLEQELLDIYEGQSALMIRGFLSDFAQSDQSKKIGSWFKIKRQFQDQIEVFEALGVGWEILDIESEESSAHNAQIIREHLINTEEKLIIVTHSKGGIDLLRLLIDEPELVSKISVWLPAQAPFFGTPAADWGVTERFSRQAMSMLLGWAGGGIQSLESLSVGIRSNFMFEFQNQIAELVDTLPIFGLAAWKPEIPGEWDTAFEPYFRDWLNKRGLRNDGIVPVRSARIPGARFVQIDGMDHLWRTSVTGSGDIDGRSVMLGLMDIAHSQPSCALTYVE